MFPAPTSLAKPIPANRPTEIQRRESKRQQTLEKKKASVPPLPASEVIQKSQLCAIKNFSSWSAATVPIHVLLMRDIYADAHEEGWGLMSTADSSDPFKLVDTYGLRRTIEERHRLLKCFYDLSDFPSRTFNAVAAQVVFILLSYTLRQWQLWKQLQQQLV